MRIFNKCHALFLGFLVFAIVGAAGYSVNQGDYFQHQYIFIIIKITGAYITDFIF